MESGKSVTTSLLMYTAVCGVYVPRNGAGSSKTSEVGAEDSSGSEFKGRGMECSQGKRGMCSGKLWVSRWA